MFKRISILGLLLTVPAFFAHAAFFDNFKILLIDISDIVDLLTGIAVALALLFFFWGLAMFISRSGDTASREEGKNKMIWGIIALFVIISVWGIIGFLQGELLPGQVGGSLPPSGGSSESGFPQGAGDVPCQVEQGFC